MSPERIEKAFEMFALVSGIFLGGSLGILLLAFAYRVVVQS